VKCLCHKRVIDQARLTRKALALGVAQQFFGAYLVCRSFADAWVCCGLARYLAALYCQRTFGNSEYQYQLDDDLNQVLDYEQKWGGEQTPE